MADNKNHNKKLVKPPFGITPKWLHDERRKQELANAICRYAMAGVKIPEKWISEFNSFCNN